MRGMLGREAVLVVVLSTAGVVAAPVLGAAPAAPPAAHAALGEIAFPTSGAAAAQEAFLEGVLWLHSFEYQDAREAFQRARELDAGFAMAAWGEAMTHNHPLWAEQDRDAALAALARLAPTPQERRELAPTDREKGLLAAVEVLYGEGDKASRDLAYEAAMAALAERYPEDLEIQAFHALSILGTTPHRDFRIYMRAAAVAEEVFAANPRHPGAVHYLIHSYDDPIHAPLGLRAARVYAEIAPAATHAQHMISHIYTALGEWPQVIAANRKAVAVSEERLRRRGEPLANRTKHSLLWLEYALLQEGRFGEAAAALATMAADAEAAPSAEQSWHLAAMRGAYAVADPGGKALPPSSDLPEVTLDGRVIDRYASAVAALAAGDLDELRRLSAEVTAAVEGGDSTGGAVGCHGMSTTEPPGMREVVAIMDLQLRALVRLADGNRDEGLALLEEAAAAEGARPLEYGPPWVVKPSHELLGEALLAFGRPAEAQARFAESLDRAPRRAQSLAGLARAARAAGDAAAADAAERGLAEVWQGTSPPRAFPFASITGR